MPTKLHHQECQKKRVVLRGLAFDNYDRLTETLTEKDILHETVGIAYQTVLGTHFLPRNSLL